MTAAHEMDEKKADDLFRIETDVPLPWRDSARGLTAALRKLEVGHSFVAPEAARNGLTNSARRLGISVTSKKLESGRVRVWRVA